MLRCSCGQAAATACRKQQCGRCCLGCSKHPRKLPPPGEPGRCECGQVASPACEHWLCARCCRGCSRHDYAESESCYEESDAASPYSYHGGVYAVSQPYVPPAPMPGQPGSCSCGQIASPSCDNQLCARCCNGCSRHEYADSTDDGQSEWESDQDVQQQQPQRQDHIYCACGQCASHRCVSQSCRSCCQAAVCDFHGRTAAQYDSEPEYDYESEAEEEDEEPAQFQPQQLRCTCGQAAAAACSVQRCASCCFDSSCERHRPQHEGDYDSDNYTDDETDILGSMLWHAATGMGGPFFLPHPFMRMAVAPQEAPAAAAAYAPTGPSAYGIQGRPGMSLNMVEPVAPPAGAAVASSSLAAEHDAVAARRSTAAAGSDQRHADAAGPSSSSSAAAKAAAAADGPSHAEEALIQLKHCVVCLDEPRSVLLLPCKHLVLCGGCMLAMQRQVRQDLITGDSTQREVLCPVCREPAAHMVTGVILS